MAEALGRGSVTVARVKGHATDLMVAAGQVRSTGKLGNDKAPVAAEFGRRSPYPEVLEGGRLLVHLGPEACARDAQAQWSVEFGYV